MSETEQAAAPAPTASTGLSARLARILALSVGGGAAGAVLVFGAEAPWWMAPFAFVVVGVVVLRLIRPMPRIIGSLDEV
ncbi:MAG: hypothetical protein ACTSQV_07215 [Alphaproteobacteria bacterium]